MKPSILKTLSALALTGAVLAGCNRGEREDKGATRREDTTSMGMPGGKTGMPSGEPGTGVGGMGTGTGGTHMDTSWMFPHPGMGTGVFDTSRTGTGGGAKLPRDTAALDTVGSAGPGSGSTGGGY